MPVVVDVHDFRQLLRLLVAATQRTREPATRQRWHRASARSAVPPDYCAALHAQPRERNLKLVVARASSKTAEALSLCCIAHVARCIAHVARCTARFGCTPRPNARADASRRSAQLAILVGVERAERHLEELPVAVERVGQAVQLGAACSRH